MKKCTIKDLPKILEVMKHPDVQGPASISFWIPILEAPLTYVLMPDPDVVFMVFAATEEVASGHVYAKPCARGKRAIKAERVGLKWLIANTPFKKIVGFVYNKPHIERFHSMVGMQKIDIGDNIKMFIYPPKE